MMAMSSLIAQGASPAYNFCKDMFLYAKGQKKDIEDLEERMSKLINDLTSINSEKERIDRLLTHSPSMEQSQEYKVMQSEIAVINKKSIKFINKYAKITNNQLSSTTEVDASTASLMIEELGDLKSKIVTLNALKLAKLSRDVEKLSAQASKAVDRLKPEKKSEPNQEKLNDDHVLPVFDTYVDEVLHYLFEEEGKKVGILGCQGAGKTTVLRKLYNRMLEQKSSMADDGYNKKYEVNNIIRIEIPPETEADVEILQNEIMIQLDIDHEVSRSRIKNANTISTFLRHKKYILLIDDVSSIIDLEKLGLRRGHEHKKVVVCSKYKNVLRVMTEHEVEIKKLKNHEALILFKNICREFLDDRKSVTAEIIIKCCGGIPWMIRNVAMSLKGVKDEETWDHVRYTLQSNYGSLGLPDKIYEIKYEGLATVDKKCLLYGALFPLGYKIQADHLIECWIAEGFISIEDNQKVTPNREYGRSILNRLIDQDLLQWYSSKEYVTIQPDFRKVALELDYPGTEKCAIWVPSEDRKPDEKTWTTVTRMSLIGCETDLPESPQCPNMHTLLLQSMKDNLEHLPDLFFIHMDSLKVLNLNHTEISVLPRSIKNLVNLKSLYLNGCLHLRDLPPEAANLVNLEFLDIRGTSFLILPEVISFMVNMRCLRASLSPIMEAHFKMLIPEGIISNLRILEELSLITAFDFGFPMAERVAKELASLEHLNTLCFSFPNVNSLNTFVTHSKALKNKESSWSTHTFRSFRISVGCYKTQHLFQSHIESSHERWFRFCTNEEFSPACQELLNQASAFELVGHDGFESFTCSRFDLHPVKVCKVESCKDLKNIMDGYIINEEKGFSKVNWLHNMKKLHLYDLESLQCIWNGPVPPMTLANLTAITIIGCNKLTRIFDPELALYLRSLEYLKVENCSQISKIIEGNGGTSEIVVESGSNWDLLRSLKKMELSDLPELISILGRGSSSIRWTSLKSITVMKCSKLSNLSLTLKNARKLALIQCEESWWNSISFPDVLRQHFLRVCFFKEESIEAVDGFEKLSKPASKAILKPAAHMTHVKLESHQEDLELNDDDIVDMFNTGPIHLQEERIHPNPTLSLVDQDLHELEKPDRVYHDLLILHLQRNKRLTIIHSSFFDSMPDLRFLDISDTKIRTLPSSLFNLPKLKVLLLRNCICLEGLSSEIEKLIHLEELDLSGAELYDIPDEIGRLASITSMHLSFYGPDDESEYEHLPSRLVCPSFLAELNQIQTLSVSVHPKDHRWNEIATDIIKDLSKLKDLSDLEFYFPVVETFEYFIQSSLSWEKMRTLSFNFTIGQNVKRIVSRVPYEVEQLLSQQERCLRYVNGDSVSPLLGSVLVHVTSFYLDHHTQVRSLSDFDIRASNELKFCVVRECPKIEAFLDEQIEFPSLEYLGIFYLWEMKNIWKAPPRSQTAMPWRNFEALKYLTVKTCPKIRFVLEESMLHCLTNLEELVVEDCEAVEKIIEKEKEGEEYEMSVELPKLRKVVLNYLPELVSLGCGVVLSEGMITICDCPKYAYTDKRTA